MVVETNPLTVVPEALGILKVWVLPAEEILKSEPDCPVAND